MGCRCWTAVAVLFQHKNRELSNEGSRSPVQNGQEAKPVEVLLKKVLCVQEPRTGWGTTGQAPGGKPVWDLLSPAFMPQSFPKDCTTAGV